MIIDTLAHASAYSSISPRLAAALEYLRQTDVSQLAPGKYPIQGEDIFALVQVYETKPRTPELKFEAHRQYIDVQYVAQGVELLGYADLDGLKVTKEYDQKDDYLLGQVEGNYLQASAGTFLVFFPQDAHAPCLAVDQPAKVLKVVVKVKA